MSNTLRQIECFSAAVKRFIDREKGESRQLLQAEIEKLARDTGLMIVKDGKSVTVVSLGQNGAFWSIMLPLELYWNFEILTDSWQLVLTPLMQSARSSQSGRGVPDPRRVLATAAGYQQKTVFLPEALVRLPVPSWAKNQSSGDMQSEYEFISVAQKRIAEFGRACLALLET